ncbi:insulinase family protein [Chimaeribacter arupi]|uniref:Insulinase family protein n=2 Tax=Yersiniaceae TaxID=1903411 RepID=A0A2N5EPJ3_9GAMM|nr:MULTISPECIES: pitrilysin family protein [Yersiniaceae]MBS0967978.1 insulinase family protein [Nissabacter archeti]MDV5140595.1 pitrilysin family protein [Chimaeribacter arupi]PLR50440.1 insulinase family protein [Chimaeribacter arupi]PLR51213.1 insulinase family protein [Chimaeribacter arupi]PLR54533.1 insulinase family protein [Chimaeribacter arupi]
MQGTKIRLLVGGLLLVAAGSSVQAEALQPDPAWQQGKLDNGFTWQLLATPQRPSDRIQLRLIVRAGSLVESAQQTGFAHLLPHLALIRSQSFSAPQLQSLWQQAIDNDRPLPPAISSYDYTMYNLSLPNNRPELLKEALAWLSDASGALVTDAPTVQAAVDAFQDPIGTQPADAQDPWWRYRMKGSTLLAHDPGQRPDRPVNIDELNKFYRQWYTPDAMTLYVVGNVDSRSIGEQITKTFGGLKGKRETPPVMPTLSPLPSQAVTLINESLSQDRLSLVWDAPWQPIRDSQALSRYWRSDLAREALFMHLQQQLNGKAKAMNLGFDCQVQYQRSQCAIRMETPNAALLPDFTALVTALAKVRDNGLTQQEFDALMAQKNEQLSKLFATYARTSTDVLITQRLRSQENGVVDIAPELYQKLRQEFLTSLSLPLLNQELKQQLSVDPALVLMQPKGEAEMSVQALQDAYNSVMLPAPAVVPSVEEAKADAAATVTP